MRRAPCELPAAPRRGREECARVCVARMREHVGDRSVLDDLPDLITAMVSHTCAATRKSCVMKSIVRSRRSRMSASNFSTWAWIETSSADTGSSATSTSGSSASARAMPIALPLTAGELVGIAAHGPVVEADQLEQLARLRHRLALRHPVNYRAFRNELAHGASRIERTVRVLKDHLDAPSIGAKLAAGKRGEVDVPEQDASAIRVDKARDAARDRRLAGARFTDEAQRFAPMDRELTSFAACAIRPFPPSSDAPERYDFRSATVDRTQRGSSRGFLCGGTRLGIGRSAIECTDGAARLAPGGRRRTRRRCRTA